MLRFKEKGRKKKVSYGKKWNKNGRAYNIVSRRIKRKKEIHSSLRDITHKIMRENEINFIHISRQEIIYFLKKRTYRYTGEFSAINT